MGWPDLASRALKTVRWTVFTRRDVGRRARAVQIRPMFSRRRLLQIKRCNPLRGCILVGPAGFEPTQWRSQSPLPYRLATAQQKKRPRSIITVRSLVGCLERFELSASRATIWRANQLRHRHHRMRPKGLEPPFSGIGIRCVIQLRHGQMYAAGYFACRFSFLIRIIFYLKINCKNCCATVFSLYYAVIIQQFFTLSKGNLSLLPTVRRSFCHTFEFLPDFVLLLLLFLQILEQF